MDKTTKYARPEHERRFLVASLPNGVRASARVIDRYIDGTRLRLRRIETLDGEVLQWKLGQKVRPEPNDASYVLHTTIYLAEEEYALLEQLPGAAVTKIRHLLDVGGVDVYEDGTMVHEVEFATKEEAGAYQPPIDVVREVTDDETYTGFGFATKPH